MTLHKGRNFVIIGAVLAALILVMGALILFPKSLTKVVNGSPQNSHKLTIVKESSQQIFPYLVPKADPAWQFDAKSPVFDQTKGIVKYNVILVNSNSTVTISQQKMPQELKPVPSSAKFNKFIIDSNVTFSKPVGPGTAYFREALKNGVSANGATTVIYAANDSLLFGQSGTILDYDIWAKLLGSMQLVSSK